MQIGSSIEHPYRHKYREYGHQYGEYALFWFSEEIDDIYHVIVEVLAAQDCESYRPARLCPCVHAHASEERERARARARERERVRGVQNVSDHGPRAGENTSD